MVTLRNVTFAALIGAGALVMATTNASARIVCNEDGDCWHAHEDYDYRPEFKLTVHPDDWKWKEGGKYRWHEHEGRGYWHGGAWTTF
jgi:hypothetical protein